MSKRSGKRKAVRTPQAPEPPRQEASAGPVSGEKAPPAAPSTPPRGLGVAAAGVFLVVFAAMAATAGDLGLTWD